jgi:predicted transcriptional regulator
MLVGEWMSRDVVSVGVNDKISRVAALMRIKEKPDMVDEIWRSGHRVSSVARFT